MNELGKKIAAMALEAAVIVGTAYLNSQTGSRRSRNHKPRRHGNNSNSRRQKRRDNNKQ